MHTILTGEVTSAVIQRYLLLQRKRLVSGSGFESVSGSDPDLNPYPDVDHAPVFDRTGGLWPRVGPH